MVPTNGGVNSGDPCLVGQIPGVALYNKDASNGTVVDRLGVYNLSVAAIDSSGSLGADANVAVAVGDIIYYGTGNTPKLSKRAGGVRFGYALAAITAGATATIEVAVGY